MWCVSDKFVVCRLRRRSQSQVDSDCWKCRLAFRERKPRMGSSTCDVTDSYECAYVIQGTMRFYVGTTSRFTLFTVPLATTMHAPPSRVSSQSPCELLPLPLQHKLQNTGLRGTALSVKVLQEDAANWTYFRTPSSRLLLHSKRLHIRKTFPILLL